MQKLAHVVAGGAARALFAFTPNRSRSDSVVERDLREAREAFARFVALEAAHDPRLVDLYSDHGAIIELWRENGVDKPAREVSMRRYKAHLREALAVAARAGERSHHTDVSFERTGLGAVLVRSWRDYSHCLGVAPYEAMLEREADGQWRITREMALIVL